MTAGFDTVSTMQRYDGVDALLADARSRLDRLTPAAAFHELTTQDALLVDIRPASQRADHGEVAASLPVLVMYAIDEDDRRVIVLCQEGYTSSRAADALQSIGIHRATDVVGGFDAWSAAGLPVAPRSS